MDAQTQLKVDIISKVESGKISISNASKLLKKSWGLNRSLLKKRE